VGGKYKGIFFYFFLFSPSILSFHNHQMMTIYRWKKIVKILKSFSLIDTPHAFGEKNHSMAVFQSHHSMDVFKGNHSMDVFKGDHSMGCFKWNLSMRPFPTK
jgi:hypothetical protein